MIEANLHSATRSLAVRYGNVLASRGSVIPLFLDQIAAGGPVTITSKEMTRFFLDLTEAVEVIKAAYRAGRPGEVWVPHCPAMHVVDVARALIGGRDIRIVIAGIRPGEKLHEYLISPEEARRTRTVGRYFVIQPQLPELDSVSGTAVDVPECGYSSQEEAFVHTDDVRQFLLSHGFSVP